MAVYSASLIVFTSILVVWFPRFTTSLTYCQKGTYEFTPPLGGGNVCELCLSGTFMPYYDHRNRTCFNCTKIEDERLEILMEQCNRTQDAVIHCVKGYYRRLPMNPREKERCEKCTKCEESNLYEILPCRTYQDTHCCHGENFDVVPNKDGVPVCLEKPWFCRRGQYFKMATCDCSPCPSHTFMPIDYHTINECFRCRYSVGDNDILPKHGTIIQLCNETHPDVIGCEDGFFINYTMGYNNNDIGCSVCKRCNATDGMYESRKCGFDNDTVCCPQINMAVADTNRGPECVPFTTVSSPVLTKLTPEITCAEGQYLYIDKINNSVTCRLCPSGTFMNESNHNKTACKEVTELREVTTQPMTSGYSPSDTGSDKSEIVAVLVSVLTIIILLGIAALCLYRHRRVRRAIASFSLRIARQRRNRGPEAAPLLQTRESHFDLSIGSDRDNFLLWEKEQCQKKPRHKQFYSLTNYKQHLPEFWRTDEVLKYIDAMCDVTVRIRVLHISRGRPDLTMFGSGIVWGVSREFSQKDNEICSCKNCEEVPDTAIKQWGQFEVITTKHLVYDEDAIRRTECDLWYDDKGSHDMNHTLRGVGMRHGNDSINLCVMHCVTHDQAVSNKLKEMVKRWNILRNCKNQKLQNSAFQEPTVAVVISHPHGMNKRISIGRVLRREEVPPFRFTYDTQTCPGSGGAPVCMLDPGDTRNIHTIHSRSTTDGESQTAGHDEW